MNFISSYMYITFIRFFYLEVGCDCVGECSVKGALGMIVGGGKGRWRKVCIGSAM